MSFTDEEIFSLFGKEAAEDEVDTTRFNEYFLKTEVVNSCLSDIDIRLIVGHKGIGKSALFKHLKGELHKRNESIISITPLDIKQLPNSDNIGDMTNEWICGLKKCIILELAKEKKMKFPAKIADKIVSQKIADISEEVIDAMMEVLKTTGKKYHILVDDIDIEWTGDTSTIRRTSAMINAIRKLVQEYAMLYFKVSIRTDAYYQYRKSDESTDKIGTRLVWLKWDNNELLALLAKRIITYFGGSISDDELINLNEEEVQDILGIIFEKNYHGEGKWSNIPINKLLVRIIRKRPRDLIKICHLAARKAHENKSKLIGTNELFAVFNEYSQERLQDTINEYKSELPTIDILLHNMRPTTQYKRSYKNYFIYTNDQLHKKIKNIMNNHNFTRNTGIEKGAGNRIAIKVTSVKDLEFFLYKINFLLAIKDINGELEECYFEEQRYLLDEGADYGFKWKIHPAFHWALNPGHNYHDSFITLGEMRL
jgi:energy-coupling factor transporter ATP-binding protein EcfA2